MITYGSVCSGIESASVAWEPLGMRPSWFSEVEPFPSAVLAHHWPNVPNLGDMTNLAAAIRAGIIEAPDVLVGGTPCQAFSVAGLRGGLSDGRGQLTLTYVDILNAIDEQRPDNEAVCVWENVPGVLSSKDNAFGCFLAALVGEDLPLEPTGKKWSNAGCVYGPQRTAAWRILDAQYFGVAQRRRRVFVVASARKGFNPSEVLFESEGVRRDSAPSREKREEVTRIIAPISHPYSWAESHEGTAPISPTLDARLADGPRRNQGGVIVATHPPVIGNTLTARMYKGVNSDLNEGQSLVLPIHDKTTRHAGKTGKGSGNGLGVGTSDDPCPTLTAGDRHAVAFAQNSRNEIRLEGGDGQITGCLSASSSAKPGQGYPAIESSGVVRRLTPVECERLQGFPDRHTLIPWKKKPAEECPDGPRYKAIGNSKAVPVVKWIGVRLLTGLL